MNGAPSPVPTSCQRLRRCCRKVGAHAEGRPSVSRLTLTASRASFPSWPGFIQGQFLPSQPTRPRAAKVRAPLSPTACWLQPCLSPQQRVRGQPCVMMSLEKGTCWKTGLRVIELGRAAVGRQVPRAGVRCRQGLSCCSAGPSHKWGQAPGAQRPSQSAWTATPALASMLPPGCWAKCPWLFTGRRNRR